MPKRRFSGLSRNWHGLCYTFCIAVPNTSGGISRGKSAMFNALRTAAPRVLTTIAASGAVIATFALGMAPMAAHAATLADTTVTAVSAPVQHVEMDENGIPSLRVSYAGLDLANAGDRTEMNRRIAHAATQVCAPLRAASVQAERSVAYQNCRSDAIAQGQAGIDGAAD
jgi:UrcA family protein